MTRQQHFNILRSETLRKRSSVGNQYLRTTKHNQRAVWWQASWQHKKRPFGISRYVTEPYVLLQRHMWRTIHRGFWRAAVNMPDPTRWEKVVNSQRVTEDRWSLVEEGGALEKVSWDLYSKRLQSELKAAREGLPQYSFVLQAAPIHWKSMDIALANIKGLSVREAMAQGKLSNRKGMQIAYKCLEYAALGAEGKGLDRDRLRILFASCWKGPTDSQIDIRSRGFYSWKTKRSTHVFVCVGEDPEMVLPDRTQLPFSSILALKKAGLYDEPIVLDVPAITAEGI